MISETELLPITPTAETIHAALRKKFRGNAWAYISNFRAGTGYAPGSERYLDAFVIEVYPSSAMIRIAIEIKISRSDFKRELKQPFKRDSALRLSNEFYFAAPAKLLTVDDIPTECGLIEVANGEATITVEAPFRETGPATWPFVASLARRVMNL